MSFRKEMERRKLLASQTQDKQASETRILKAIPLVKLEAKASSSKTSMTLLQKIKDGTDLNDLSPMMDIRLLKCVNFEENQHESAEITQSSPEVSPIMSRDTGADFGTPNLSATDIEKKKVRLKNMRDLLDIFPERSCEEFLYECIPQILTTHNLKDSANFFHRKEQSSTAEGKFTFAYVFAKYPAEKQTAESFRKSASSSGSIEDELAATITLKTTKSITSLKYSLNFDFEVAIASGVLDEDALKQASLAFHSPLMRFHAQDLVEFSNPEYLVSFEVIQQQLWWVAASRSANSAGSSAIHSSSSPDSHPQSMKSEGGEDNQEDHGHQDVYSASGIPICTFSLDNGLGVLTEPSVTDPSQSQSECKIEADKEFLSSEELARVNIVSDLYSKACSVLCTPVISRLLNEPFAKVINVSHHSLGNNGISSLAVIIMNSSRMELLDIFDNGISHIGVSHLCSSLLESKTIRELRLDCNPLGLKGGLQLSSALGCNWLNTSIETLSLWGCKLGDSGCAAIFKSLLGARSMKCLNLSANGADIETAKAAADVLPLITRLEKLSLRWNYFKGSAAVVFCQGAMSNRSITEMDLSWNAFGEVSAVTQLGEALKIMNHLKSLDISYNRIDGRGAYILGSALEINHHISFCNFSGNPVGMLGARLLSQLTIAMGSESAAKGGRKIKLDNCSIHHIDDTLYNPCKTDGKYQLDLSDNYSRIVMCNILRMRDSNQGEILEGSMKMNGEPMSKMTWNEETIPYSGFLQFQFEAIHYFPLKVENRIPSKQMSSIKELLRPFRDEKRGIELFEMLTGNETYFSAEQVQELFTIFQELSSRLALISLLSHQIVPAEDATLLKNMLTCQELHAHSISISKYVRDFTNLNPTGHYRLNMDNNDDRRLMENLIKIRSGVKQRLKQRLNVRQNGVDPDNIEWCVRNLKWNGKDCQVLPGWMPPSQGVIEFDFTADIRSRQPTMLIEHSDFLKRMSPYDNERDRINLLRQLSNTFYFRAETALDFLETISNPQSLEECIVTFFSTIYEHAGFQYILHSIGPTCRDNVIRSIGIHNCWCEGCAVAYYVLDLSNIEHRFVCKQLIALSIAEHGESIVDEHYNNKSFSVPVHWQERIPIQGIFSLFFCRDQAILDKFYSNFGQLSLNISVWKRFQPAGTDWVHARKRGIIKDRIKEKFPNAETAFQSMDRDGGGSLSRVELSTELRKLGIWLQSHELEHLMSILDEDNGGTVEREEFLNFWNSC